MPKETIDFETKPFEKIGQKALEELSDGKGDEDDE